MCINSNLENDLFRFIYIMLVGSLEPYFIKEYAGRAP